MPRPDAPFGFGCAERLAQAPVKMHAEIRRPARTFHPAPTTRQRESRSYLIERHGGISATEARIGSLRWRCCDPQNQSRADEACTDQFRHLVPPSSFPKGVFDAARKMPRRFRNCKHMTGPTNLFLQLQRCEHRLSALGSLP